MTYPALPHVETVINDPAKVTISVFCQPSDNLAKFKAHGTAKRRCAGYEVENKVRFDFDGVGGMAGVATSKQNTGDLRTLAHRVATYNCSVGLYQDYQTIHRPCERQNASGGDGLFSDVEEFSYSAWTTPTTQEECVASEWYWNYVEGTCQSTPHHCDVMPEPCDGESYWSFDYCQCMPSHGSPIVVDVDGDGFDLTDAAGGVGFDLDSDGSPEALA